MFNADAAQGKFTHERINDLVQNQLTADPGATYAKSLYLSKLRPQHFLTVTNSLQTCPLYLPSSPDPTASRLQPPLRTWRLRISRSTRHSVYTLLIRRPVTGFGAVLALRHTSFTSHKSKRLLTLQSSLVSCTNSRASDIAQAAKVFRDAAADGATPKIADGVKFYIAAASTLEQQAAEEAGDWQVLLDAGAIQLPAGCGPCIGLGTGLLEPGENGISASNRNFKGRMGSTDAKAYLASPEVVAASALKGKIAGPGWYQKPEGVEKVIIGEGSGNFELDKAISIEDALDKLIAQAEGIISNAEKDISGEDVTAAAVEDESLTEVLPGFPEKVEGEIVFCDADNINTDGIYPGKCECSTLRMLNPFSLYRIRPPTDHCRHISGQRPR
jgi:homoaconitate hydratase